MKKTLALTTLLTLALAPLALAQDAPGPLTWVAFDKTKSGMSQSYIGHTIENDGPMFDGLVADGTIASWGMAIPIHHNLDDDWNVVTWVTMADWGKVQDLQGAFEKSFAERGPEKMMENQKAYQAATVEGMHHDWIIRHQVINLGSGEKQPRYFRNGYHTAKPGQGMAVTNWYKKYVSPIYDGLVADGTLTGHGMYTQEVHGSADWTHVNFITVAALSDLDKVDAAIDSQLSAEAWEEIMGIVEQDKHSDQILLIVHPGGMGAEE